MAAVDGALPPGLALAQEQDVGRRDPVDGARPVADKGEQADDGDVKVADAVVGARQVDRRDGVGAAQSEEGGVLQQQRRRRQLGGGEVLRREELEEHVEEEEERDVGGARLGHGEERAQVVQRLDGRDALGHAVARHDEVDDAGGGEREADENGLGAHDERAAVGEVDEGPGETGDELGGVLVGEGELEREGGEDEAGAADGAERGREAVEPPEQFAVDP